MSDLVETAVDNQPGNATVLTQGGDVMGTIGQSDAALALYRRALTMDPSGADALLGAARVLLSEGEHAEAHNLLRAFLEFHPDHPESAWARSRLEE